MGTVVQFRPRVVRYAPCFVELRSIVSILYLEGNYWTDLVGSLGMLCLGVVPSRTSQ